MKTADKIFFWRGKSLDEMTDREWELLCDGCAKCCVAKYEDEDTGDVYYSNEPCRFLDADTCRCTVYKNRGEKAPECASLTPELVLEYYWLPETCAYRLVAMGKDLPEWHPLLAGKPLPAPHRLSIASR